MNAILYAAGRATRLGAETQGRHKVLLEFGGQTLLERHVMILAQLHIPKLHVVTGYRREQLQAFFPRLQQQFGVEIAECFNPDFAEGSCLSMHASLPALKQSGDRVLLMDADVLYDVRMLSRLINSAWRTALLVDRGYSTSDDDPVLVPMRQGQPFDFIKGWRGEADQVGESVGFFKLAAPELGRLIHETEARARASRTDSYDDILRVLVKEGCFGAEDVTGIPWTEIDFPEDIEHARRVVLPALLSSSCSPGFS